MSGSYQHNIPQALLRGFRAPGGSKKKSKVWLYEKGCEPELALIKREVGGERFFYSELSATGDKTLDDHITDYETDFTRLLAALKSADYGSVVDAQQASEVVAHLTIRNAHLRRTMTLAAARLFEQAAALFGDEKTLRLVLGVDDSQPTPRLKEAMDDYLARNPELANIGVPKKVLYHVAQMTLKEQFNRFFQDQIPGMIAGMGIVAAGAPAFVRNGHNKAIAENHRPEKRIQLLEALAWSVHPSPDDGFILPDCVALGEDDEQGFKSLMMTGLKEVRAVLMPLSSSKILVGLRPGVPVPNLAELNRAAAASSLHYFVAAQQSDALKDLQQLIATSSTSQIEGAVESALGDFAEGHGIGGSGKVQEDGNATASKDWAVPSFGVSFVDCADEETAKSIASVISAIVQELCKAMPLDRLDGITFARDYIAALRNLDRGYMQAESQAPRDDVYGVSAGTAPLVWRDGVPKAHVVMRGDIAYDLIDEDYSRWQPAVHGLVTLLARTSSLQMLDETLPEGLRSLPQDRLQSFLYPYAEAGWSGYFTARASAIFWSDAGREYSRLLLTALRRARADIPAARYDYRFHGDVDHLLSVALPRVEDVLRFSGKMLGHCNGLARPILDDDELARELQEVGLQDWFVLFDNELSELWGRQGKWTTFDEFLHINRHVERVLWQFGLFPLITDDGQLRMEIPLGTDAHSLRGVKPWLRGVVAWIWAPIRKLIV